MKNFITKSFFASVILLTFGLSGCTDKVAGGSSEETNTIAGVLTGKDGVPLAKVAVSVQATSDVDTILTDTTDSDGKFSVAPEKAGTYGICAETDSSAYYETVEFSRSSVEVAAKMMNTRMLEGYVYIRPDSAAIGAKISIPGSRWSTTTDSNGFFTLNHVPASNYDVYVKSPTPSYVLSSIFYVNVSDTNLQTSGPASVGNDSFAASYAQTITVNFFEWTLPLSPEYAIAGYWTFDYFSGTDKARELIDSRGRTDNATVYGETTLELGRDSSESALAFDDANDFAVIEDDKGVLDSATALTVEAWVNISDLKDSASSYSKNIFGKLGFGDSSVFSLAVIKGECGATTASFAFFIAQGTGDSLSCENAAVAEGSAKENEWIYVVGVWDGASVNLYVNSKLAAETETSIKQLVGANGIAMYFGKEDLSLRIDEIRISTAAITLSDVFYRYQE